MLSAVVKAGSDESHAPLAIGRYVIARVLGAGGMGIVYAAHDPELDRTVAVKVLRGAGNAAMQERLRREAQAMAQIAHPHVVPVHDVGVVDEQLFVVMEYVEGETLAHWCEQHPAPREILRAYREAARGLAAAHAAGIVHRDFKPENALVGADGRVRVADFGLARTSGEVDLTALGALPVSPDGPTAAASLTQTGMVLGTPYYLAPELYEGADADARSDQFSFCVALFTALCGARPFAGDTLEQLRASVTAGELHEPSRRLPRRIRAALRRGLSRDPAARFPSMMDLVAILAPPARRWPYVAAAAAAAGAFALAFALRPGAEAPCQGAAEHLRGVWDIARAHEIDDALAATRTPFAEQTAREVRHTFDVYAADWQAMHVGACEATRVRKELPESVLEVRMACLDERLHALAGAVATIAAADRDVAAHAVAVAEGLPAISDCADITALVSPVRPPSAAAKAKVAELRAQLSTLAAERDAGKYSAALAAARALEPQIHALDYRPLEAAWGTLVGSIEREHEDFKDARTSLERAVLAAEAGRDDRAAADALVQEYAVVGHSLGNPKSAAPLRDRAEALLERLDHPLWLRAELAEAAGDVDVTAGKIDDASRELHAALAAYEEIYGKDDLHLIDTLRALAYLELQRSHSADAKAYSQRALAIQMRVLGDAHPDIATTLQLLGNAEAVATHYDAAETYFEKALALTVAALGPDSAAAASILSDLSNGASWLGDEDKSLALSQRAVEMDLRVLGPDHPTTLAHQAQLASSLESSGLHWREARILVADILPRYRARYGPAHQMLAYMLEITANIDLDAADYAAARDHAGEAIEMYRVLFGDTYDPWEEQRTLGEALIGLGDFARATTVLATARAHVPDDEDPGVVARIDMNLGEAQFGTGDAAARATLAKAWAVIAKDDRMQQERADFSSWLVEHHVELPGVRAAFVATQRLKAEIRAREGRP
ncbi:MAG TPA: serine/threonine-protein kinase [Kofleriaceae bacterium]